MFRKKSSDSVLGRSEIQDDNTVLLVEEYASQLLDFSGQYGSDNSYSYTATNCLGVPTKFPNYGDFPQTYVLREFGSFWNKCPSGEAFRASYCSHCQCSRYQNFIDLKYPHAVHVNGLYIYETFHPGAVTAIFGGDCFGHWMLLWKSENNGFVGHKPRVFSPPIATSIFKVQLIRLVFCHDEMPGHTEIDAVALLGTTNSFSSFEEQLRICGKQILKKVLDSQLSAVSRVQDLFLSDLKVEALKLMNAPIDITFNGYFDELPREVIFQIFTYLDLISLGQCCQVSKLFNEIGYDSQLYSKLCLKSTFSIVSDLLLDSLSKRCSNLTHLDLSWCGNYSKLRSEVLTEFIRITGHKLIRLRLNNCHSTNAQVLREISLVCSGLEELSLANCHLIASREFESLSRLERLKFLNLNRTRIGHRQLADILRRNLGLQCLNVSSCNQINGDEICQILSKLHQTCLISLEMWRVGNLTELGVFHLSEEITNLVELDLGWCQIDVSSGCVQRLVRSCTHLKKLFLTAQRQTSDRDILAIATLSNLTLLDIMGTRLVTINAINLLLQSCRGLKLLDIAYCEQLENPSEIRTLISAYPSCHIIHS